MKEISTLGENMDYVLVPKEDLEKLEEARKSLFRFLGSGKKVECPDCGALGSVEDVEKYDIVECHTCGGEYEFDGKSLVRDES